MLVEEKELLSLVDTNDKPLAQILIDIIKIQSERKVIMEIKEKL